MKKRKSSFAIRLALNFMMLFCVATLLLSLAFFGILSIIIGRERNSELIAYTNQARGKIIQTGDASQVLELPYYISYIVYDFDTKEIISTNDPFLPILPLTRINRANHYFSKNYYINVDLNILYLTRKFMLGDKEIVVQISSNIERSADSRFIKFLPRTVIHILIPLIIVSFLTCYFMVRKTLRPVMKMMESARKISSENFDELLPVSRRNDELDQLAVTFNDLFSRLKFDFERERNFTSDVSHELKTPVAIILGEAKLLKRWGKDDPEQLEDSLNTIIEEGKSMNEIIKNLLQMTRLENGQIELKKDKVFIKNMFARIENEYKSVCPGVKFDSYVEQEFLDTFIETDGELLHQVLAVAVSNSIKFVGENCVIKLSCKRNFDNIVISVEDNGPGFSENILPHVFERFYRGDSAHTRNVGGAGLGLSIASVIMNALGGKISAKNAENHGAVIELVLK